VPAALTVPAILTVAIKPRPTMHLSRLLLLFALLVPIALAGCATETPAEHAANVYAADELAAAPPHGNLADYSLSPEKLAQAQHLSDIGVTLHFASIVWSILQILLLLSLGVIAWMRDAALRISRHCWVQGYAFVLLLLLASFIMNLPLKLYGHNISLQYGFSIQRWPGWFFDQAKSFAGIWLIGGLVVTLLFWIIGRFPRRWWLVFWLCWIPITIFGVYIAPYGDPLFYKFEPLQQSHPHLVEQLEKVVQRGHMNIPPDRMFLMKASSKVTTLNAYVTGFGSSKRVVVWDTSIAKGKPDEILFIFGHEAGHYVLRHVLRGTLMSIAGAFVVLYLGYRFVRWAIARFGPRWRIPSQHDWAALVVLLLAVAIFNALGEPISNTISRYQEHAADVYGQEAIHGLVTDPQTTARNSFEVLGTNALEDPNPGPFIEFWTYGHPATGRRAAFAKAYNPWLPGLAPKYFLPPPENRTP
jgi:STE24 endopeptidase